jgi:hypothetical protein
MGEQISCTASQLDALYLWRNPTYFELSTEQLVERLKGGRDSSPEMQFGIDIEDAVNDAMHAYGRDEYVNQIRLLVEEREGMYANPSTLSVEAYPGLFVRARPDWASCTECIDLKVTGSYDAETPYHSYSAQYLVYKAAGYDVADFIVAHRGGTKPETWKIKELTIEYDPAPGTDQRPRFLQELRERVTDLQEVSERLGIYHDVFKPHSEEVAWLRR